MSEYIYSPSNIRIKPIQGLTMPKNAHTYELHCISSMSRIKKKGQKGKQMFYFFRPDINKPILVQIRLQLFK